MHTKEGPDPMLALWEKTLPGQEKLGLGLIERWSEPHRHYHDLYHIGHVLHWVGSLAEPHHDQQLVELAAWYHDAIYQIGAGDNEAASAALAETELAPVVGAERAAEVARLVRLTRDHLVADDDVNGALLCDADLVILGSPGDLYEGYAQKIRREYAAVPDDQFRIGRAKILQSLLERDPLFRTAKAQMYHERARANLTRERDALLAGDEI